MCLARKGIKIMVTLVTVAYKALFYKGLIGNQPLKYFGYGNLKNGYCGGNKDAGVYYAMQHDNRTTYCDYDKSGDRAVQGKNGKLKTEQREYR